MANFVSKIGYNKIDDVIRNQICSLSEVMLFDEYRLVVFGSSTPDIDIDLDSFGLEVGDMYSIFININKSGSPTSHLTFSNGGTDRQFVICDSADIVKTRLSWANNSPHIDLADLGSSAYTKVVFKRIEDRE